MIARRPGAGAQAASAYSLDAPPHWSGDSPSRDGLRMYADVVRARLGLVALVVAVTVGTAAALVSQAEKVYRAEADMLVTPIPRGHDAYFGLGLVTETGDPTRDAETLAKLITTPEVAERVRRDLGVSDSARELLRAVTALPVAQTSIVTITAEDDDPVFAARLANAFGEAVVAVRTEKLHARLDELIPQLHERLAAVPAGEVRGRENLRERINDLEALRLVPDPTLRLETRAAPSSSPVAPRPAITIAAALVGGLVLGIAAVFGLHVLAPRIEREEDLRRYRIPIVGRIPRNPRWRRLLRRRRPLLPSMVSFETRAAFHRLASLLVAATPSGDTTLFVTSPAPGDGKTTTSINVAAALGALNEAVLLVDADSRQPAIANFLPSVPKLGLTDVVSARAPLEEALSSADGLSGVRVLAQTPGDQSSAIPIAPDAADRLLREAGLHAKWLVFDGPALASAPEALPLAKRASSVLLVVRLHATGARDLAELAELLTQQGITPAGFVVIGSRPTAVY